MTRKRKTEQRKNRNLNELKTVQNNDRKALNEKQGGEDNFGPIKVNMKGPFHT